MGTMNNLDVERVIYNIIVVICFLFVANLFMYNVNEIYQTPSGSISLKDNWSFSREGETVYSGPSNTVILMDDREKFPSGLYSLTNDFLYFGDYQDPVLVIPAMEGNGVRIFINDRTLAVYGDMERGRSSRWNTSHVVRIPEEILQRGRNRIRLDVLSLYKLGIHSTPYITDIRSHGYKLFALQFFSNYSILLIIGNIIALGFILILMGVRIGREGLSKTFLGIGLFVLAAYMLDYQYIELLPVDYVLFKKIIVSFSFISPVFVLAGINIHMKNKIDIPGIISMALFGGAALYILTCPPDSIQHEIRYGRVNWVYAFILLDSIWLYLSQWEKKTNLVMLAGLTFTGVIMVHDIGAYHSFGESILFFHYGVNFFIISLTLTVVGDSLNFYSALKEERKKVELAMRKTMIDALTGAFNRRVLQNIENLYCEYFSLLLIDLDHFKNINDNYGHFCGDRILKEVVQVCLQLIRDEDYCIRLGGDEFVIFLPHCREEGALVIADELKTRINDIVINNDRERVSFSCSIGVSEHEGQSISEALKVADKALYRAKITRDSISL
ncbi:GGDEF domain-containing protein [Spirochaeta isovalerica]|uniref:diguanylate cyclase n=1 Tax=Spirochaeta isovalerica TaxID=150 RepID=A0A841R9J7_9SPIO|nr:GGDEF domain-containing protein [Spirochaeta isovalerica]MBB6482014.1 diguanylate cyclase (GGDEF)-like protein [Spirochaeta isovalerica]